MSFCWNPEALTTRDNKGETPIDIAHRSGACAEIIGLFSLTPEEARSLSEKEMVRLYAPVAYWRAEMAIWIQSRSYADCHKLINGTMTSWCVKCPRISCSSNGSPPRTSPPPPSPPSSDNTSPSSSSTRQSSAPTTPLARSSST